MMKYDKHLIFGFSSIIFGGVSFFILVLYPQHLPLFSLLVFASGCAVTSASLYFKGD